MCYSGGGTEFRLSVPQLDISPGAKLALVGESGSGKSTLLELLAMILRPTQSTGFAFTPLEGESTHDIAAAWQTGNANHLSDLRSRHIGYVLQNGGLLPYLSVRENINISRRLLLRPVDEAADYWADKLDISRQLEKLPSALSVGQRQRVAIARALAHDPAVLIADEPTASVDPCNAGRIMGLMAELVDDLGVTLIVASHDHGLMKQAGLQMIDHSIQAVDNNSMHVTVSNVAS